MDRFALLIDAGYVFASVAELLAGSPDRRNVRCDFAKFVAEITADLAKRCGLPLLRTYWYDASLSGQPEFDQEAIADIDGVRLRLGRLVRGEQKGVDSRIVRDLIVLARDKAIAEAFVLAGDEDLVEGVEEAQDQGLRVTLLGVPGVNQSRLLVQQADQHYQLPAAFWKVSFSAVVRPTPPVALPAEPAVPSVAPVPPTGGVPLPAAARVAERVYPAMRAAFEAAARTGSGDVVTFISNLSSAPDERAAFERRAEEAGQRFAQKVLAELSPADIERLRKRTGWEVPYDLDVRLLRFADDYLGGKLWERSELKPTVRRAFWDEFRRPTPAPSA